MELVLTIIAGLGVLLFLIGYLAFVAAGFRHHFVTGLISALPVLNIVTIPALWHATGKKLVISVLGVALIGGSWFLGADKGINKTLALLKGDSKQETVVAASHLQNSLPLKNTSAMKATSPKTPAISSNQQSSNQARPSMPYANKQHFVDESKMQGLPGKALYKMIFETIPVDKISALKGRVVQITTNNNEQLEGRIKNISNSSVLIQASNNGSIENELPIANIKQLRLMVKKAN